MKARIHVITLAVRDLERSLRFYRDGLGWPSNGIVGTEFVGDDTQPSGAVVFFDLEAGLMLALYPRHDLAKDANLTEVTLNPLEFSIGYLTASRQEVDDLLEVAKAAGATMLDTPRDRPWGIYSGYFQDPDGHLWEIIWNPQREAADDSVTI